MYKNIMKKVIRILLFVTVTLCTMNVMAQNNDDKFLNAIEEAQQKLNSLTTTQIPSGYKDIEDYIVDTLKKKLKLRNDKNDTIVLSDKRKSDMHSIILSRLKIKDAYITNTDGIIKIINEYDMFDSLKKLYTENLKLRKKIEELRKFEKDRIDKLISEDNEWLDKSFVKIAAEEQAFMDKLAEYETALQNTNISKDAKKKLNEYDKQMKALKDRYSYYKNCIESLNAPYDKEKVDELINEQNSIIAKETIKTRKDELSEQVKLLKKYKEKLQYFQFFISYIDEKVADYKDRQFSKERAYTNLKDFIETQFGGEKNLSEIDAIPWLKTQRKEYNDSLEKDCYGENKARDRIMSIKL